MATPSVQIGDWLFVPDSPLGVTYGFNGPHATEPQLFKDMAACGMSRVRMNVQIDNLVTANPTDPVSGWNWGFVDSCVAMANTAGLRVTLIARGLPPTTRTAWSVVSPCFTGYYPTSAPNYAVIALALARRYSGDGNSQNAKDPNTGKRLQADCIEFGNEEFNSMPDPSPNPKTGCGSPLKYVSYVRTVLPLLRAPVVSGGGNWVPRGNFLARVGAWGIVHSAKAETEADYTIFVAPPTDSTWNPGGNHHSIFGFDPTLGCQMLDYANLHNYNPPTDPYSPAVECADIRTILNNKGGLTNIPIWITETGADGPCANDPTANPPVNISQTTQASYFTANPDGTGTGLLPQARDAGCQHIDIFTMNYNQPNKSGTYIGEPKAIACALSAGGFIRFQAFTNVASFTTNVDKGAWAAKPWPAGFGTKGGTVQARDVGARFKLIPTVVTRTRDIFARLNLSRGTGGHTRDIFARLTLNLPGGMGLRDILTRFLLSPGTQRDVPSRLMLQGQGLDLPTQVLILTDSVAQAISDFVATFVSNDAPAITALASILSSVAGVGTQQTMGRLLTLPQPLDRAFLLQACQDVVENIASWQSSVQNISAFYQQFFSLMDALEMDTGGLATFLQAYANTLGVYPPSGIVNAYFAACFNAYAVQAPSHGFGTGPQSIPNWLIFPYATVDPLYTFVCGQDTQMLYQMGGTSMAAFGGGCAPLYLYKTNAGSATGGATFTITYIDGTGVTQTGTYTVPSAPAPTVFSIPRIFGGTILVLLSSPPSPTSSSTLLGPSTLTNGSVPLGIVGSAIVSVSGTGMTVGESYSIGAPLVRPSSY